MNQDELKKAVDFARQAVQEASIELKSRYGNIEAQQKEGTDAADSMVTELDRSTEQLIDNRLREQFPDFGFSGEEFGMKGNDQTYWCVDPIDGTQHFVRGNPFCTTQVALVHMGQVVASVIHDIAEDNTYWAVKGGGAFRNDQPIHVSNRNLSQSYLAVERNLSKNDNPEFFRVLEEKSICLSLIAPGKDFTLVAEGKIDGRITKDGFGNDWDYAAGSLLVSEAGGVVANIGSNDYDFKNYDVLAVNPVIYHELTSGSEALFPVME